MTKIYGYIIYCTWISEDYTTREERKMSGIVAAADLKEAFDNVYLEYDWMEISDIEIYEQEEDVSKVWEQTNICLNREDISHD